MKKVVVIGGGTGTFSVLSGLRDYPLELSAIVTTADDGGSTGILRDELGVLPPGDVRQALVALSAESSVVRQLFNYRFNNGSLKGHSFGNLFLSALEKVTGSFEKAVLEAGRVLAIKGSVIPVTSESLCLKAESKNGHKINGEHNIEEYIWTEQEHIKKLWLEPQCSLHPLAARAIKQADLIVIAPGSIFTSLIPNLLVTGMKEALSSTRANIVYVVNLMTEKGQAGNFFVQDFVELIEKYLGTGQIDYVVYNRKMPESELLIRYKKEMERIPVRLDRKRRCQLPYQLIGANLVGSRELKRVVDQSDGLAKTRTLIRHDAKKLAQILHALTVLKEVKKLINC